MKHASILLDKALAKKAANVTSKHFKHPTKRPVFYNLHALCLYREALARAMDSLQYEGVTVEMALSENFTGALLKALLKAYSKMLPKT